MSEYLDVVKRHRPTDQDVIRDCASRVFESGVLGTGRVLPQLLRYLVDMALKNEVPKEFDIAVDVFDKGQEYRDAGDAQIRVWVYKLRSRLDRYYAGEGKNDSHRLNVPKGTYQITTEPNGSPRVRPAARSRRLSAGIALGLAAAVALTAWLARQSAPQVASESPLLHDSIWSGVGSSERPIMVVLGDHFFFGGADSPIRTRDIRINSEEDLRTSAEFGGDPELVSETLSYLPKSVAFGLQSILPRAEDTGRNVGMKLVSELTSEDIRTYDIVFVGFIRSMGILRDYYFARSSFSSARPFLDIVHPATGHVYARSGPLPERNTDYGLFARLIGPSGNQILVFSGIGDPGVLAAARSLNTATGIRQIDAAIESNAVDVTYGWEALLEVDGHSRTDLDFRVLGTFALGEHLERPDVTHPGTSTASP